MANWSTCKRHRGCGIERRRSSLKSCRWRVRVCRMETRASRIDSVSHRTRFVHLYLISIVVTRSRLFINRPSINKIIQILNLLYELWVISTVINVISLQVFKVLAAWDVLILVESCSKGGDVLRRRLPPVAVWIRHVISWGFLVRGPWCGRLFRIIHVMHQSVNLI